jgi:hypothetical protein
LVPCCDSDAHCINLVVKDAASKQGVFDIMDELDLIGKAVSIKFASCTVLCTGDLLVGKQDATRREVLDAMISNWMNDPVHGTKAGYSKIAMKLAERVEADLVPKAKKVMQRKRAASPEVNAAGGASGSGSGNTFPRNIRGRSGFEPGYNFVPGSHPNQRGGWLPGFTRGVSPRRRWSRRWRSRRRWSRTRPRCKPLLLKEKCTTCLRFCRVDIIFF